LRKPFANDNNSLNKNFYFELLYILGLYEDKDEGKKVIVRNPKEKRQKYSLLENTISLLSDDISDKDKQFNIALELVITWINRILFLKLLEAQLLNYQNGNRDHALLNIETIKSYNELNKLFFKVLAIKPKNREDDIKIKYKNIPYLNSSLFDKTETENRCSISSLENNEMNVFSSTVLKDVNGNMRKGKIYSLEYIFSFLDAYNFSNDDTKIIRTNQKTIINASVLGLIFEKINGYKDGSYFTPGFVTSFICSEAIKNVIVSKFNIIKNWNAKSLIDIYNKIDKLDISEANEIINRIKILDPAVGSGHFLVSSLNEIISIKSFLGILVDKNGKKIKEYKFSVSNDELEITNADTGMPYEYNCNILEKQIIQETIFNEKRRIIENSLFGVDINKNSVNICRLRLWIELLKSAYYTRDSKYKELETLPNLELNIKCGNSLVNRFDIDVDISEAIKNLDFTLDEYKASVKKYKTSTDRTDKQDLFAKINKIKESFKTEIKNLDRYYVKKQNIRGDLTTLKTQMELFEFENTKREKEKQIKNLEKELAKIESIMNEIEQSKIYNDAFEWRFEFPELLDDDGSFMGFDAVIGNPPYIKVQELDYNFIDYCKQNYSVAWKRVDISILFIELGNRLIHSNGVNSYITSNQFLSTEYGEKARLFLLEKCNIKKIINFGDLPVFPDALTYVSIFVLSKGISSNFLYTKVEVITDEILENNLTINVNLLDSNPWSLNSNENLILINNLKNNYPPLNTKAKCWAGLFTGKDEILQFDKNDIDTLNIENDILLPVLRAQDCNKFRYSEPSKYVIYPYKEEGENTVILNENELSKKYPKAFAYLLKNKKALMERKDSRKNMSEKKSWYGLIRFGKYSIFKQPKIISPGEVSSNKFSLDISGSGFSCARVFAITIIDKSLDIYFLLGLLNSKLVEFYLHSVAPLKAGGYYQYSAEFIDSVPLPKSLDENKFEVGQITKYVHELVNPKSSLLISEIKNVEEKINKLICKLYGLSQPEIELVEGL
jgi:hypothetical protein